MRFLVWRAHGNGPTVSCFTVQCSQFYTVLVVGSSLAAASASVVMAEGCSRYIISGWGLSQDSIHSPPDLDDAEDFQLSKGANVERFGPSMPKDALDEAIRQRIPLKTQKTTQWAVSVFRLFCNAREISDSIENLPVEKLAELLPHFVMEARRQDGTPYPPNTLVMLVSGIQRHLRENGRPNLAIMGDKDGRFARTRAALDARMKEEP